MDLKLEPPPDTNTAKFFFQMFAFGLLPSISGNPLYPVSSTLFLHREFLLVSEGSAEKEKLLLIETHLREPIPDIENLVNDGVFRVRIEEPG